MSSIPGLNQSHTPTMLSTIVIVLVIIAALKLLHIL